MNANINSKSAKQYYSRQHWKFILSNHFSEQIRLGISCELSARQTIHMHCQALFSLKEIQDQNAFCCRCG